jgi:hypothetical protein
MSTGGHFDRFSRYMNAGSSGIKVLLSFFIKSFHNKSSY